MIIPGAVGGDGETDEDKEKAEEEERERREAIQEAEDRRKEKHRKMEEEREKMRQEIRDKVRIIIRKYVVGCHSYYVMLLLVFVAVGYYSWDIIAATFISIISLFYKPYYDNSLSSLVVS